LGILENNIQCYRDGKCRKEKRIHEVLDHKTIHQIIDKEKDVVVKWLDGVSSNVCTQVFVWSFNDPTFKV
jgi:hypothetical protein